MIARRKKAITWFSILFGVVILLTLLLGLILFPRPGLPPMTFMTGPPPKNTWQTRW